MSLSGATQHVHVPPTYNADEARCCGAAGMVWAQGRGHTGAEKKVGMEGREARNKGSLLGLHDCTGGFKFFFLFCVSGDKV